MTRLPTPPAALALRIEAFRTAMTPALAGSVEGVHEARVASRRLRELLPVVLDQQPGVRALRRRVRRATRALGCVRELDVTRGLLDELDKPQSPYALALGRLRDHVRTEREVARRRLTDRFDALHVDKMAQRLMTASEAASATLDDGWRRRLADRLLRRADRLRDSIDQAGSLYDAQRLHVIRIAAKKVRYSLEIVGELTPARTYAAVRRLKTLQDLLGRMHDLAVAAARAQALEAAASPRARQARASLRAFIDAVEDDIRRQHAQYLAGRAAVERVVHQIADEVCPALQSSRSGRAAHVTSGR